MRKGAWPLTFEFFFQELTGVALGAARAIFRCAGKDDAAARVAALRTEIDDMIGHLDDVQVVLNDEHRVARVGQTIENIDQARDVRHRHP